MNPWEMSDEELAQAIQSQQQMPWEMSEEDIMKNMVQEPTVARGDNTAGLIRNIGEGLLFGFGDEVEAAIRGALPKGALWGIGLGDYASALTNARESQRGYAKEHPVAATVAQIGGGLLPAVATFGATAPASGATLGSVAVRGGLAGLGAGAVGGFGSGEGGLSDRLENAGLGAAFGLGAGAGVPALAKGLKGAGLAAKRIVQGTKEPLSESEISRTILENIIDRGGKEVDNAITLANAAQSGDKAISNTAKDILRKYDVARNRRNQELADFMPAATWGEETPEIRKILDATRTPELAEAQKMYSSLNRQIPQKVKGGEEALAALIDEEPKLAKLINNELTNNAEAWRGVDLTSRDGLSKIINKLNTTIENVTPANSAASIKKEAELRAVNKLKTLKETLYPGTKKLDAQYSLAKLAQKQAEEGIQGKTRGIYDTLGEMINESLPKGKHASWSEALRFIEAPYNRGKARELILRGSNKTADLSKAANVGLQSATEAITNALLEVGKARPSVDVKFGSEPLTDDPNAWYNQPVQY